MILIHSIINRHTEELKKKLVFLIASPLSILYTETFPISWSTFYDVHKTVCFVSSNNFLAIVQKSLIKISTWANWYFPLSLIAKLSRWKKMWMCKFFTKFLSKKWHRLCILCLCILPDSFGRKVISSLFETASHGINFFLNALLQVLHIWTCS